MKFIFTHETEKVKPPTVGDVELYQFFVSKGGYLCQKICHNTFIYIANHKGEPEGGYEFFCDIDTIERIIPQVAKIEF